MKQIALLLAIVSLTAPRARALELTCPDSITVACRHTGQTDVTGRPVTQSDCGGVTLEYRDSIVTGQTLLIRTWTASDSCGASQSCTQRIYFTQGHPRVAVLPFENLASAEDGVRVLARLLEEAISRAPALELIGAGRVEEALLRGRIRQPYVMDDEQRARLTAALDAEYFVIGSLLNYSTYNDQYAGPIPMIACTLQLQRAGNGEVIWSESIHAVGSDGEWLFGLGVEHDITRLASGIAGRSVEKFTERILDDPCFPAGQ